MDILQVILRILHIVFGVFWVGTVFFSVIILQPRLKALGPAIQNPVMGALMPLITPLMMVSAIILIGTGIALVLIMRWGALDTLFVTGWGWSILLSFVTSMAAAIIGFGVVVPAGLRMAKLGRSIQGRPPKPEEAQQLGQFAARIETLTRTNFVLLLIALVAMPVARFL
jgi:uncharacterized membrane protein